MKSADCPYTILLSDSKPVKAEKTASEKLLHIQGIRGVAIVAVILFHFFPSSFSNGYLGVDLFFTLSGFLMATVLSRCPSLGVTEIFGFFYRRIKRIVPLYYLCTFLTMVSLFFFVDTALQRKNIESAKHALLFVTNLIRPQEADSENGYFTKLEEASDTFTHTWSLALEMQFYLVFPFIFGIYRTLPERVAPIFFSLISGISFAFYLYSDSFLSFNSVFSRIWQFTAGTFAFLQSTTRAADDKEKGESTKYVLISLLLLLSAPNKINPDFARVLVIVLSIYLLQFGSTSKFLEHHFLVYIGQISYGWYLVHWPIAVYCKYRKITNVSVICEIVLLTCLCSLALYHTFEKHYLRWERKAVTGCIVVLCVLNAGVYFRLQEQINLDETELGVSHVHHNETKTVLKTKYNYQADFNLDFDYGYENKTKEERLKLNEYWKATDWERVMLKKSCPKWGNTSNENYFHCIYEKELNERADLTVLVVGNGYASNVMPVIYDECRRSFSKMEIVYRGGCEVLSRQRTNDCIHDGMYLDAIREYKPDVLFLIQRHFSFLEIFNGSSPFDDNYFKMASERLTEIEKHVKKRIFILNDFPEKESAWEESQKAIESGNAPNDTVLNAVTFNNIIGRIRIQRLAAECEKCKVYDHTPQLFINGTFKFYDPKTYMSFVTWDRHLTPAGLERVRPLYRHLCNTL